MARLPLLLAAAALAVGCEEGGGAATTTPGPPAPLPVPPSPPPGEPVPPEITRWVAANAIPFDGSDPSLPHDGIEFLRGLVMGARIVALGDDTYGTRDFSQMKVRIVRYLVEELGFDTLAIPADPAEARRLDRYLRTGEGDPAKLLTGLYFWGWRTETMLGLIEWMRSHNETGGSIRFRGFGFSRPGMPLHEVREYLREADPAGADAVGEQLHCLEVFANDHRGVFPDPGYADQTDTYREACGESLERARTLLLERRAAYAAATGEDAFEAALRNLRVAVQYHLWISGDSWQSRTESRAEFRAENVEWLAQQIGPTGRIALWAHNSDVSGHPFAAGSHLRETFGDGMLVVASTHESGEFTAIRQDGNELLDLDRMSLEAPLLQSFEHYVSGVPAPRFALDLRRVDDQTPPGGSWLSGTRLMRFIHTSYDPARPARYWRGRPLSRYFDVILHHRTTGPTVVLPELYPDSFRVARGSPARASRPASAVAPLAPDAGRTSGAARRSR